VGERKDGAYGFCEAGLLADGVWGAGGAAGLAGGLGMYRGPVWPQPANTAKTTAAMPVLSAVWDFTIRIWFI
jgi:hypothetical protein